MTINKVKQTASELLSSGKVKMVIGYAAGKNEYVHAYFATTPEEVEKLVFDDKCERNLTVYLNKKDVKEAGRVAIVARPACMRSIIHLASENQITGESPIVIGVTDDGEVRVFEDLESLTQFMKTLPLELTPDEKAKLEELRAMTREERWAFWNKEFDHCIKCYACRAACPLCYCTRCTVECNQPQWIHVSSHELGNLEWHIMRAMHLAGRCINCGECRRTCPMDIPLNLLTQWLILEIEENFDSKPANRHDEPHVLATYKPDDKENFIR